MEFTNADLTIMQLLKVHWMTTNLVKDLLLFSFWLCKDYHSINYERRRFFCSLDAYNFPHYHIILNPDELSFCVCFRILNESWINITVTYILMYINVEASFNVCPGIVFNCGVRGRGYIRVTEYIMMSFTVASENKRKTNGRIITVEI